jgi:hypothetical protein
MHELFGGTPYTKAITLGKMDQLFQSSISNDNGRPRMNFKSNIIPLNRNFIY